MSTDTLLGLAGVLAALGVALVGSDGLVVAGVPGAPVVGAPAAGAPAAGCPIMAPYCPSPAQPTLPSPRPMNRNEKESESFMGLGSPMLPALSKSRARAECRNLRDPIG